MPGVNRRTIRCRLVLIRSVPNYVVKLSVGRGPAQVQLANRIAHAVPLVSRSMRVASVRRLAHQNAHPLRGDRLIGELQCHSAALPLMNSAAGKSDPHTECRLLDRIFARPILHFVVHGVRLGPRDSNCAHRQRVRQIKKHPLRMQRVAFTGVRLRQIRIALPIGVCVSIRQSRLPFGVGPVVARDSAVRQRISIGMANWRRPWLRTPDEISAACRVAPLPFRIPVPGLHVQFGVLAIGRRLPPGRKHFVEVFLG